MFTAVTCPDGWRTIGAPAGRGEGCPAVMGDIMDAAVDWDGYDPSCCGARAGGRLPIITYCGPRGVITNAIAPCWGWVTPFIAAVCNAIARAEGWLVIPLLEAPSGRVGTPGRIIGAGC